MTPLVSVALATLSLMPPGSGPRDPGKEILFGGLGKHRRPVTTSSPLAQRYFDQGLNFLFAFNHDEAIRSFTAATRIDPKCGMAWWGIATAHGPHINNPFVSTEQTKAALAALKRARALRPRLTSVERALIDAAGTRYRDGLPARTGLDKAYADTMRLVWRRFPKDADVGALFAESLMDLRPWDLWQPGGRPQPGTPEITDTLGKVLRRNPNHPLALHLSIHAWEASPHPERADVAAARLRNLQPGLGHMVHMPSHIDVRRGRWREAIIANEKAIRADEQYRARRPRQGFYRLYMAHNRHMLGFAAMMIGQSGKSIAAMDALVKGMPKAWVKENAAFIDGYVAMPMEARVRFGRWDEVLAWPEYPEYLPLSRALRRAARGVAYAAKGNVVEAETEQRLFLEAKAKVPAGFTVGNNPAPAILAIAEPLLAGEILMARGQMDGALVELRKAVRAEDQLRYDEPPDWIIPTRHVLGVALLKAGRHAEAERVYREDLKRLPGNGWSLYGLSEALARQGKTRESASLRQRFTLAWKSADMPITSSCMCVPKP